VYTNRILLTALSAVLACASVPAQADVVHLEGGRQIVGRVLDDGDIVRVEMSGGVLTFPRARVARIERSELPSDALEKRLATLEMGDVEAALTLAEAACAAHLPETAGRVLERARDWAPEDERVREAVTRWHYLHRRLPPKPGAEERLRRAVGEDAHVYRSAHWRVAYDVTTEEARERATALEVAWRGFHRLMLQIGLHPEPVDDRMEALLFEQHADWVRATGAPPEALAGLNGIYVGPTGRILLFDPRTAPEAGLAHDQIAGAVAALAEKAVALENRETQLLEIRKKVEDFTPTPADREGAQLRKQKLAEIDGLLARSPSPRASRTRTTRCG
jgi:hypothetical protein